MLNSTWPGAEGFTTTARRHRSRAPTERFTVLYSALPLARLFVFATLQIEAHPGTLSSSLACSAGRFKYDLKAPPAAPLASVVCFAPLQPLALSDWIPFGDHPLKLERYRED